MTNDPVADFITRIKNASMAGRETVSTSFSNFKMQIAELLLREGYLSAVEKRGKKVKKYIDIKIKYENDNPEVRGVKRISHLGKRVYLGVRDIRPVKYGQGILVISTPKGLMTDRQAKKARMGGEALFSIW